MLRRFLIVPLLLAASAATASAQIPAGMPSGAQMAEAMALARQALNPAAALLARRQEMELTAAQVATLDTLAAPMDRFLEEYMVQQASPAMTGVMRTLMDPSAEIDEEAVRRAYREQGERQADLIIRMLRMERSMADLLTPAQMQKRQALQLNSIFGMMRAMGGAAPAP